MNTFVLYNTLRDNFESYMAPYVYCVTWDTCVYLFILYKFKCSLFVHIQS